MVAVACETGWSAAAHGRAAADGTRPHPPPLRASLAQNLLAWVVAGALAYRFWYVPEKQREEEQQVRASVGVR